MCEQVKINPDMELVDDTVDWCLVNNCSVRWALRWQLVEEDLETAIQAKQKALEDIKKATTRVALKRAKLERNAASVAIHRARDSKISLMLSQRISTAEWLKRLKNKKATEAAEARRQKKKCFEATMEEKRCAAIISRIREWDALAAKRAKGSKPAEKPQERKPSDTKPHDGKPPDDKPPPGSGQKPSDSGHKPGDKPAEPEKRPAHPEKKPAHPEKKPAEPDKKPAEPDKKPAEPDKKPAEPDKKPAEPDKKPAEPDKKPAEPDKKPAEPDKKPAGSGDKPTEAGPKPPEVEQKPPELKPPPPPMQKPPNVPLEAVSPGGRKL